MDQQPMTDGENPALQRLEHGETVHALARAATASVLVTDRRVAIVDQDRLALDVPFDGIRRIQFDIERQRPATLVIVPEHPSQDPQVIAIPPDRFDEITRALALIGTRLHDLD